MSGDYSLVFKGFNQTVFHRPRRRLWNDCPPRRDCCNRRTSPIVFFACAKVGSLRPVFLVNCRACVAVRRSRKAALTISRRSALDGERVLGAGAGARSLRRFANARSVTLKATCPATATGMMPVNAPTAGVVIIPSYVLTVYSPPLSLNWLPGRCLS